MTHDEIDHTLRQLRLGGMADALTTRTQQARADNLAPMDFLGLLLEPFQGDEHATNIR